MNRFDLQLFAVDTKTVKSADLAKVRDVDFTEQFVAGIQTLMTMLGVTRKLEKKAGETLKVYKVTGTLESGTVAEGEVIPLSRAIMGTAINVPGAIVPLIMGTVPFFSRQVEGALDEIDHGLIEAVLSMGSSPLEIIFRVYLRESVSAIARGTTITAISLVGLTAMAGAVGSGGLGNFAIQYGHDRNMTDVTWVTVIVVFIIVSIIQLVGNLVVKKNKH